MILSDKEKKPKQTKIKQKQTQPKQKQTNELEKNTTAFALKQPETSYFVCKCENNSSFRRQFSTNVEHYFLDAFFKGQLEKTMFYT